MSSRSTFQMLKFVSRVQRLCRCYSDRPVLDFKRALIFSKLTRYEFERHRNPTLSEAQLERLLRKRGLDFDLLQKYHNLHKDYESVVVRTFEENGIETRVVTRFEYDLSAITWCDVVVPTGGDGTFLLAACRVFDAEKPVIGFNSDTIRSTGHLCLPKRYSENIQEVVDKLKRGQFEWKLRSRIRVTLSGVDIFKPPVELHDQELMGTEHRFFDCVPEEQHRKPELAQPIDDSRVLPVLALNEVFMGECLSARVSYMELRVDGGQSTRVKNSGVCVCTGTGSTSWHSSISRVTEQTVSELMDIGGVQGDAQRWRDIADAYNKRLIFKSEDTRLCYSVRDQISDNVWPNPKGLHPRGYATNIEIRSRCFNAGLVIDGGYSFDFNDGTVALLEIRPTDSLRTVRLSE